MSLVETVYGTLEGTIQDGFDAFLGVPYAKPPVGTLRWREPEPPEPWEGVREACSFGPPCCQGAAQVIPGGDPADRGVLDNGSEDCLYLNVWTPNLKPEKPQPVFVWIHGGAFCCGSGAGKSASPAPFCGRGIVYVTLNYRLGLMGYFAHPELSAESPHHVSGNYAHFDQIMALRWVRENIAAFGGDPDRVTIGGCSAGAGSTQVLCNSPLARGLFQRAIIESSVGLSCAVYPEQNKLSAMADMERRGVEYATALGKSSLAELRAMSYEELVDHPEAAFRKKYHYGTSIGLNEDGYLLPRHYNDTMEIMENADIPYLVGNTADEGGEHVYGLTMERMREISGAVFGEDLEAYMALCQKMAGEDLKKMLQDTHLRFAGAQAFAALNNGAGRKPVYVFSFARKDPSKGKAYHGLETQYLLGAYRHLAGMTEADDRIARTMQEYWCQFIRTGDPNCEDLPEWRPYTEERPEFLRLDDPVRICHSSEESPLEQYAVTHVLKVLRKHFCGKETGVCQGHAVCSAHRDDSTGPAAPGDGSPLSDAAPLSF